MKKLRLLYIPGWAAGPESDSEFTSKLQLHFDTQTLWLPEFKDKSQPPESIYSQALVNKLQEEHEPVALVGWSLGGMAALEAASACPTKVAALALIATTAKFCADNQGGIGKPVQELLSLRDQLEQDPEKALRTFILTSYYPARPARQALQADIKGALSATPDQLRAGLDYLLSADLMSRLTSIRIPTLVIHGEKDSVIPVEAGKRLSTLLPEASLHIYANTGHALPQLKTDELCDQIASFILRSEPGTNPLAV